MTRAVPVKERKVDKTTGWKLVPVELTRVMRDAFHESYEAYEDECEGECPDSQWEAMLAAAPAHRNVDDREAF